GLPGCNTLFELRTGIDMAQAVGRIAPSGECQTLPPQGLLEIDDTCAFYCRADGGGRMGDPLLRPPEDVLADVQSGLVSTNQARNVYGVAITAELDIDGEATAKLRGRLQAAGDPGGIAPPVEYRIDQGVAVCRACSYEL